MIFGIDKNGQDFKIPGFGILGLQSLTVRMVMMMMLMMLVLIRAVKLTY